MDQSKQTSVELLKQKYPKLLSGARLEIPTHWYEHVEDLCQSIQGYIDRHKTYIDGKLVNIPQVECTQIKQKFGSFRFYTNIQEPVIQGMIMLTSYICANTCEHCGSREDIGYTTKGYVSVCCKKCSTQFENWSSKNEIHAPTSN